MTNPAFVPKPVWQIRLLGELRAVRGEQAITRFRRHTAGVLLAYLAYYPQRSHPREEVIDLLWPECEPAVGRDRLSTDLSSLRRQLEPPGILPGAVLRADRSTVGLNASAVTTDVGEFEAALALSLRARNELEREQWLREAVERYQGELLPGYFEEWILPKRQHLTERYCEALKQVSQLREQEGDLRAALEYAHRAVSADPLREEAQHELIRLLAAAGQTEAAERQYQKWERLLKQEMGSTPEPRTQALVAAPPRSNLGQRSKLNARSSKLEAGQRRLARRTAEELPDRPCSELRASSVELRALSELPQGTVTFLLMEIPPQGLEQLVSHGTVGPPRWRAHLRQAWNAARGHVLQESDGWVLAVFQRPSGALAAALAAQRLAAVDASGRSDGRPLSSLPEPRAGAASLRAADGAGTLPRIVLHTGETETEAGSYQGLALDHTLRLLRAAHPGQILLSGVTAGLLRGDVEPGKPGVTLVDLGSYRLRDEVAGVAVMERLFQVCYPDMVVREFPPPRAEPMHQSNLPLQLTRFFGREAEVAHLRERLSDGATRLVTLTGAGGSGKTRLALTVAEGLVEPLHGAVWFVPLVDVGDVRGMIDALVNALHLPRNPSIEPLEQVVQTLSVAANGPRPSLLVLDNFEGVTDEGAPLVRTLLERAPALTCLVTSRQRLGLAGEREYVVHPLPTPASGESLEQLGQSASVQLFVDRAQAVRPDFQITPGNAATVAELCRRLEGLPLALELAAARAPILTPVELLAQLSRPLEVLVSRQRDAPPRHRSLRATLQWSYDHLSPELQRFFAGLSLFRGGWTLEAAAAVDAGVPKGRAGAPSTVQASAPSSTARAADDGPVSANRAGSLPGWDTLGCLEQLQACSLIIAEAVGTRMRFRMLESMREFAGEQLTSQEQTELARRHALYYLELAEATEPHLFGGGEQRAWLDHLDREHDNLRAALAWCKEAPEGAAAGLRLAGALARFWDVHGYWNEGRARLEALLEGTQERTRLRAKALAGAGMLAFRLGDAGAARAWHEESLAIYQELGDQQGIGSCLTDLGNVAWSQNDTISARSFHQDSLAIARQTGDRRGVAATLYTLGSMARYEGDRLAARALLDESLAIWRDLEDGAGLANALLDLGLVAEQERCFAEARSLCEESLAIYRELGDKRGIAHCLAILGALARLQGDYTAAQALLEESLTLRREMGDKQGVGYSLRQLGYLANLRGDAASARKRSEEALEIWREIGARLEEIHQLGNLGHLARQDQDYARALSYYRESLAMRLESDDRLLIAMSLEDIATVAARQGKHERVAQLLGAAEALCEPLGKALPVAGPEEYQHAVRLAHAALGEEDFAAAWAQGRARALQQSITDALEEYV
jgi:predicted ATPase/DNA-binding SARP family transcriptional activator